MRTEASKESVCSLSLLCSCASFRAASTASGSVTCISSIASNSGTELLYCLSTPCRLPQALSLHSPLQNDCL